jgi:hypothetical protein
MPEPAPVSRNASDAISESLPNGFAARAPGGALPAIFVGLTEDAALREAIEGAVAGRGSSVITPTAEAFADRIVAHAGCIAILDAAIAPGGAAIFVERLRIQFPGLVLVITGTARDQAALAPLVAEGTVCRFAHKPVSAQRLGLFLDAALRRRDVLASEQNFALLAPQHRTRPHAARSARTALLILLLAAAAGTAMWLLRRPALPPGTAAASTAASPGNATTPQVAAAPTAPADARVPATTAITEAVIAQARREVQFGRQLMDAGRLIDPAGNCARSHIETALRLAPADTEVRHAARTLSGRLVAATRNALLAEDTTMAQRWLDAARSYGVNAATLDELTLQLEILKGMKGQ